MEPSLFLPPAPADEASPKANVSRARTPLTPPRARAILFRIFQANQTAMPPLKFFVHVPKTGGSTVNAVLREVMSPGQQHITNIIDSPGFGELVESSRWMSGHLNFVRTRALMRETTKRRVIYFTLIRDPLEQIASAYNWYFVVADELRGSFKKDFERISAMPLTPEGIVEALRGVPYLLNQQASFVLGQTFKDRADLIPERLKQYRHVGLNDRIGELLEAITGAPCPDIRSKNVSPYHFDPTIFASPLVREFLEEHHAVDIALYKAVKAFHGAQESADRRV